MSFSSLLLINYCSSFNSIDGIESLWNSMAQLKFSHNSVLFILSKKRKKNNVFTFRRSKLFSFEYFQFLVLSRNGQFFKLVRNIPCVLTKQRRLDKLLFLLQTLFRACRRKHFNDSPCIHTRRERRLEKRMVDFFASFSLPREPPTRYPKLIVFVPRHR